MSRATVQYRHRDEEYDCTVSGPILEDDESLVVHIEYNMTSVRYDKWGGEFSLYATDGETKMFEECDLVGIRRWEEEYETQIQLLSSDAVKAYDNGDFCRMAVLFFGYFDKSRSLHSNRFKITFGDNQMVLEYRNGWVIDQADISSNFSYCKPDSVNGVRKLCGSVKGKDPCLYLVSPNPIPEIRFTEK